MKAKCKQCKYFEEKSGLAGCDGFCYFYPPKLLAVATQEEGLDGMAVYSAFPKVSFEHYCSKFVPDEKMQKPELDPLSLALCTKEMDKEN